MSRTLDTHDTHGVPWKLVESAGCGAKTLYGYGREESCERPAGHGGPHAYDEGDGHVVIWPITLTEVGG